VRWPGGGTGRWPILGAGWAGERARDARSCAVRVFSRAPIYTRRLRSTPRLSLSVAHLVLALAALVASLRALAVAPSGQFEHSREPRVATAPRPIDNPNGTFRPEPCLLLQAGFRTDAPGACSRHTHLNCLRRNVSVMSPRSRRMRVRTIMEMFRLKHRLAQTWRNCVNYWTVKIVQLRVRLALYGQRLRATLGASAISLFSVAIASAILLAPQFRLTLDNSQPLESVLSQLGATYGTILALVLTLSIIPIQRAAEVWSSSIVRLYRRDPVTYATFVSLGVLCTASFLLAVRGLALMPASVVFSLSLAVLGISLDILRWYHGHICRLLDPVHAVGLALKEGKQAIDRSKMNVAKVSRLQRQLLSAEQQRRVSIEAIESTVYPILPGYPDSINLWVTDLAEIGIKAVTRGEKLLAKTAVFATADLALHYLSSRKSNLTMRPAPEARFLAMDSDVSVVTDRVYEALREVSRAAVTQGDEATAIRVSDAYQAIAIHTAHLSAPKFREGTAPLTFGPIYYAFACVKHAQSKGLDEVSFQTAGILAKVSKAAPKDVVETDIHIPVIDGLVEIAIYLYGNRNYGLAEEVNGHHFGILEQLLQRQDYYFRDVLRHVLEKLETLTPFAIVSESMAGRLSTISPLEKAYGSISPNSLGYLFERAAATLPKVDVERDWTNPYDELIEVADIIADHLSRMAESIEFGESSLLLEIDQTIEHISMVIARVVDQPLRQQHGDEAELVDKFVSILAFYSVAFHGKKTVSKLRADSCCGSLMSIGLQFLERGHPEVLRACISSIRSILESFCEIARPAEHFAIGDLLAHLWGIRMVLVARHNDALTQEVDRALTTKPRALGEEQWQAAQVAITRRRQQLEQRVARRDGRQGRPDRGEVLLRRLLK